MKKNKAITYDHTGDVSGLWTIDGKKARDEFGDSRYWEGVDKIVDIYKDMHPVDYDAAIRENVDIRLGNHNQYGSNKAKSTRIALNLPYGLYLVLVEYDSRMFRDKKKRETFMKRFNALRACDTV